MRILYLPLTLRWKASIGQPPLLSFLSILALSHLSSSDHCHKIGYRCLKARDGADYFHIATVHEEQGQKALQERDFFKYYTAEARRIPGGTVEVTPIETVARTAD